MAARNSLHFVLFITGLSSVIANLQLFGVQLEASLPIRSLISKRGYSGDLSDFAPGIISASRDDLARNKSWLRKLAIRSEVGNCEDRQLLDC
jgi:hypothetical protein